MIILSVGTYKWVFMVISYDLYSKQNNEEKIERQLSVTISTELSVFGD